MRGRERRGGRRRRKGEGNGGMEGGREGEGKNDLMHPCHKFLAMPLLYLSSFSTVT